jgi:hypothetical protein
MTKQRTGTGDGRFEISKREDKVFHTEKVILKQNETDDEVIIVATWGNLF